MYIVNLEIYANIFKSLRLNIKSGKTVSFEHRQGPRGLGCQRFTTLFIIFVAKKVSKISLLAN